MSDPVDDSELVERAVRGDTSAFNTLIERHYDAVADAAFTVLSEIQSSRECAEESFLFAAQNLTRLREKGKFRVWMLGISRRKAIYALLREKRRRERELE